MGGPHGLLASADLNSAEFPVQDLHKPYPDQACKMFMVCVLGH